MDKNIELCSSMVWRKRVVVEMVETLKKLFIDLSVGLVMGLLDFYLLFKV